MQRTRGEKLIKRKGDKGGGEKPGNPFLVPFEGKRITSKQKNVDTVKCFGHCRSARGECQVSRFKSERIPVERASPLYGQEKEGEVEPPPPTPKKQSAWKGKKGKG